MSLNEEATQDLDDTLVDDTIVHSSPIVPAAQASVTVMPYTEDQGRVPEVTVDQVKNIMNSDVQFKTIEDDVEHITELEDVEQEFLAQESICQADIKQLNEHFDGLLSDRLAIEEFTRTPTKVNYAVTKDFIHRSIAQEQSTVITDFSGFTQNAVKDILEVIDKINGGYIDTFHRNMESIAELSTTVIADLSENKNTIVPFQNGEQVEFVDIAELNLVELDFNNLKLSPESIKTLTLYRDNIKHILVDEDLRILITLVVECQKVSYPVDSAIIARSMDRPIHLLLLAKLFNSGALRAYLGTFQSILNDAYSVLSTVKDQGASVDNYDQLKQYISEYSSEVHTAIRVTLKILQHMNHLNMLAWNIKELFTCMSTITHPTA